MPFRAISALQAFAIVVVSLLVGAMFGIWQGYNPAAYSPATFVQVHQGAVRGLNILLPLMGGLGIAATLGLAFLARNRRGVLALYLVAAVGLIVAGLVTRFGNQPINDIVMMWGAMPPAGWEQLRDQWWLLHQIRLAFSFAAELVLIAAVFRDRE